LKHADRDWDQSLGVRDIVRMNAISILMIVLNYHSVFGEITDHMRLLLTLNQMIFPDTFKADTLPNPENYKKVRTALLTATPRSMFEIIPDLGAVFPTLEEEKKADLTDIGNFYETQFSELERRA
jgi:hypothetical protein